MEVRRQLFHFLLGLVIVVLYQLNLINSLIIFVILVLGGILILISKRVKLPVIGWFLDNFEREEQIKIFPGRGALYYFIGVLLVMQLFEKDIACAGIMILALGDSVGHLVGRYYGKTRWINSKKLLEGSVAGALAGFLGAVFFVSPLEAALASIGAMILEAVEIELNRTAVDDNLYMPLVAGTIIYLLRLYF
jgi:dolichol kinase